MPLILGVLLVAVTAALVVFLVTDEDDSAATTASAAEPAFDGTLFTLSNGFAPRYRNSVLA